MNSPTVLLLLILIFILLFQEWQQGKGQLELEECNLSKIRVSVHKSRTLVKGKREFLVVVSNVCWCPQSNITLSCPGFRTVQPLDPNVLARLPASGSAFLLNSGNPLLNGNPVSFNYAWDTRFRFTPLHSHVTC